MNNSNKLNDNYKSTKEKKISTFQDAISDWVKCITNNKTSKFKGYHLSWLKRVLNSELYNHFVDSLIKPENKIITTELGTLYHIYIEWIEYKLEIQNEIKENEIKPIFYSKYKKIISKNNHKWKLYLIYV